MKEEIRYPVTVSITIPLGGEKKKGSTRITRQLGEEHTAIIDALLLALRDNPKAEDASEALIDAGISKGARQGELFKKEPDGEPYSDDDDEDVEVAQAKKAPKRPRKKKSASEV